MTNEMKISPIFYMGSKRRLIRKGLIDLFPKNIKTFVDLFTGTANVSMNVVADKYIINDLHPKLYSIYTMFKNQSSDEIINAINDNVDRFGLSKVAGKEYKDNRLDYVDGYLKLREHANSTDNPVDFYSCMFYSFSQQMRFNNKMKYNMPFGDNVFTSEHENRIIDGCNFFSSDNVSLSNYNYFELFESIIENKEDIFVYLDPPYLNTIATYNESNKWNVDNETRLFEFCDTLNKLGIRWGMSNVFSHNGVPNTLISKWCNDKGYKIHCFKDFKYQPCGKKVNEVEEVYIYNY